MSESEYTSREVAHRVFSRELNRATYTFKETDEELAPVFVLLPTGAAANRVFIVGALTEAEDIGEDTEYWRARVADPVGSFTVYAGEYQPDVVRRLEAIEPPVLVAVTGKPRTFETDSGSVNVSVRPEALAVVDDATRRRWVVDTAERTLDRIARFDDSPDSHASMARERYAPALDEYRDTVVEALESLDAESPP